MRLLIACLALTIVVVSVASAFEANKVYRYDFEGAITTKASEDKPQYSGVALSTPIAVKKTATDELTVHLEKPQVALFNDIIEEIHLYKFNYKPIGDQARGLDQPFRIYLDENGSVKSFDNHKDEPRWATNFKRGLLSFFQLKLKNPASESATGGAASLSTAASQASTANHQYYTLSERSVFGECETDYLVMSEPLAGQDSSESQMYSINVTKTRNMARCKSRFMHRFMPISSSECYENEKDLQQYKHSNAIFQFELLGTRKSYVIQQALLDEVTRFSPFGQQALAHFVHTKFMLKLNKVDESSTTLTTDDSSLVRLESLSYDPPEMVNFYANVNLDQEHHLSSIYQSSASVDQVMEAFEALVQEQKANMGAFETSNSAESEKTRLAELFIRLNELSGTLDSRKIEQLYSQADERGETHKKVFWDLMSVAGTNPSFMFMKRLITDGDAPSVKIRDFLRRCSYHIKMPSKSLFDEYVNLCKSDKIQINQQYKRLCSLPLASLIHQHCAKPHTKFLRMQQEGANATAYKRGQNTCQIATAEEYFTRLVTPFYSSSSSTSGGSNSAGASSASSNVEELSIGDRMFQIKLAGELGVKPSVDFLIDVVANQDEHPVLRTAAMWNMMKAASIYPNQIKRLVVPYYYDRGELLELRIAAFHNWLTAGMTLHEMETMAKQLQREPSRQLVIYVHSLISSLANQKQVIPCMHMNDKHAKLVLSTVEKALNKHSSASMTDSHAQLTSTWHQEFGFGTQSMMSVVFSNDSLAPSNVFYSSSEIMSGLRLTPMAISIQAHGFDKLIKRVIGINGLLADKESLMDVFSLKRRSKRQVSADLIKQEAQEIDKELKLATREFSDVYVAATIWAYGRPVTFVDRDSRELKKMLSEDGTIKLPHIKKLLHSFNNYTNQQMMLTFEKLEVFNNELGLPLFQSINDFNHETFKLNSVKFDVEPGLFRDERQGKPPRKISATLDAKIGRHNEMFVSTGAIVPSSKSKVGVGFYKKKMINFPMKYSMEANLAASEITFKRQPIHDGLLYIKQSPVTFVKTYDPARPIREVASSEQSGDRDTWRPLYAWNDSAQMKPFNLNYTTPLALGLRLEGKHRAGDDWSMGAWRRYMNSVGMSAAKFMYFYSPTGQPLEARLSTITTDNNPTNELVAVISWRHHHPDESSNSPPVEKNEVERELEQSLAAVSGSDQQPPTTVNYKVTLYGGLSKDRHVSLDVAYSRTMSKLAHKWRVFYSRTPLNQAETNSGVTNLCWFGQMQFPKHHAGKLLNFDLLNMDHSANLTSELTFGDECQETKVTSAQSRVSAKVKFDWSEEQRNAIETAFKSTGTESNVVAKNIFAQLYKQCKAKQATGGSKLDPSCVSLLRKVGELTHISAQFDYKDVPERWTTMVRRLGSLYTYARAGYIEDMDDKPHGREYKSSDGLIDRAHLDANISALAEPGPGERKLSYEFDTPNYHVQYRGVPIYIPPLSTFPLLGSSFYQQIQRRASSVSCLVSGQTVQTFDNLTYTMPQVGDGCFKLITKDCSPEANFAVLGARVGPSSKVLKVYLAQKFKVEFVPDELGKRVSDIKVNGESVQIEADKPPLRRETKFGPKTHEAFTIDYNGAYYTLNSRLYKFSVSTDGSWIHVQQSKYYAGKSCGICGDANGDQLLEFKAPSSAKRVCKNSDDFVWSYVVPSTCAGRPAQVGCV